MDGRYRYSSFCPRDVSSVAISLLNLRGYYPFHQQVNFFQTKSCDWSFKTISWSVDFCLLTRQCSHSRALEEFRRDSFSTRIFYKHLVKDCWDGFVGGQTNVSVRQTILGLKFDRRCLKTLLPNYKNTMPLNFTCRDIRCLNDLIFGAEAQTWNVYISISEQGIHV